MLLSPLLKVQTVGQTPLPLFSHLIHSLNAARQIVRFQGETEYLNLTQTQIIHDVSKQITTTEFLLGIKAFTICMCFYILSYL